MSYPSSLDLAFGSEKATSDSNNSFVQSMFFDNGGSEPALPTTSTEVDELVAQGLAFEVSESESVLNISELNASVKNTLPDNLLGVVGVSSKMIPDSKLNEVVTLTYSVEGSGEGTVITLSDIPEDITTYYIILKQAVDTNP